jgi:hypothetical protein
MVSVGLPYQPAAGFVVSNPAALDSGCKRRSSDSRRMSTRLPSRIPRSSPRRTAARTVPRVTPSTLAAAPVVMNRRACVRFFRLCISEPQLSFESQSLFLPILRLRRSRAMGCGQCPRFRAVFRGFRPTKWVNWEARL